MTGFLIPLNEYNQSSGFPFPSLPNPRGGFSPPSLVLVVKDESITSLGPIEISSSESFPKRSGSVNPILKT